MGSVLVHSGTLVDASGERSSWVLIDAGQIASIGSPDESLPDADRLVNAAGCYVTPGFIDIHGHGAGGAHYQDGVDEALVALNVMRAHGTTRAVASFVTTSIENIVDSIHTARIAMDRDTGLAGVHIEGPFLAPGRKGAHNHKLLRHPDRKSVDQLLEVAPGVVRQITIAPELPGALDAISRFVDAGVPVAVGHTECDYDTAREAFARGASLVTHAFNAMAPIQGRLPGVLGAAVAADHVTIEVIADGLHVHPASIALLFAAAPGRIALVTDAIAAAAAPPGRYLLGELEVDVADGHAVVAGTDTLAGSTLTPDRALRTVVNDCHISLHDAVAALTTTPARAIGEQDAALLTAGARAELAVLDADLSVTEVFFG
jgi:N-acetylglucosamine-6-phosphate deacetylase